MLCAEYKTSSEGQNLLNSSVSDGYILGIYKSCVSAAESVEGSSGGCVDGPGVARYCVTVSLVRYKVQFGGKSGRIESGKTRVQTES